MTDRSRAITSHLYGGDDGIGGGRLPQALGFNVRRGARGAATSAARRPALRER
jgi:hypothetical protein